MILPPGKIEAIAATADASRHPGLGDVWLRGEFLEATDGYVAVRVPVERQPRDVDGPIPPLAFRLARELTSNPEATQLDVSKKNVIGVPGMAGVNRRKPVEPPPAYEEMRERFAGKERPHRVVVDVRRLLQVAEALGADGIVLEFTGHPHDPVVVLPAPEGMKGEAFVMPMKSSMAPPPIPPDEPKEDDDAGLHPGPGEGEGAPSEGEQGGEADAAQAKTAG